MVSARPRRDNTLFNNGQGIVRPQNLQRSPILRPL
jgi:hypothetical protein